MSAELNVGQGLCPGTARILVKPVRAVVEMGASGDMLAKVLNAVHHANRHAQRNDFIAVALPEMRMGRNCQLLGHEIELIGSENSLSRFLMLEGPAVLQRRGMFSCPEINEVFSEPGESGAAYIRDRACEKHTAGWLRRNKVRAARRGKPWKDKSTRPRNHDRSALALHYGSTVLHVRQVIKEITGAPLIVSTYGFSSAQPGRLAVLPVLPVFHDATKETEDAA